MQPVLRLLGRFETVSASGSALNIPGARAQLLLARLALAQGRPLDRSMLSTMLWGERADAQARASLRQLIWTIRQALKSVPDALVADGDLIRLDPVVVGTDVVLFDRLAQSCDPGDLETALALYRGDLLDGIDLISLAPDGYFLHERSRLRDLALKVAASLVIAHDRDGNWELSMQASRRGLVIDPFDEGLHGSLVGALQKLGRHREAQGQDDAFRKRLKAELGVISPPQATRGMDRRPAPPASAVTGPVLPPDPAGFWQKPTVRQVLGGVLAAAAVVSLITFGLWRQTSDTSAALPAPTTPIVTASDRLPTRNLAAYDQYLRAEAERRTATDDDALRRVLAAFRRAFTLDTTFAQAHAGYAFVAVEVWERSLRDLIPSSTARGEAYDAAGRALEIDPGNARALIVLSRIQAQDGAGDQALASARRAAIAEPDSAEAQANLALILSYAGNNSEARAELKRLQALDPVPRPQWLLIFGQAAFADERYDAAIADFVAVWPDQPRNTLLLEHLAAALALQGRFRQAGDIKDRLLAVMPRANLHLIAQRYATLREPRQNERLLEGLRRAGLPEWPYGFRGNQDQRLTGTDLAAIALDAGWSGHSGDGGVFTLNSDAAGGFTYRSDTGDVTGQLVLRDGLLCQVTTDHPAGEVCGPVYRNTSEQNPESTFVFVSAADVRYFSVVD